ncbi:MAG TPA: DUF4382 domain-containing protein [Chitinophagaceae bacterium]|jgi:hypothetical protein|nr:DUF4382 domain-containing protein [Chitinophagaceae bacterium]
MKLKLLFLSATIISLALTSCKKETTGASTLRIHMTDAPVALDEVNVDLQQVNIKFANDTSSWVNMQTVAGVYNLLGLQNGLDTLIAQGTFAQGDDVKEIRLVLGSNNSVKEAGTAYPLTIPGGSASGLKIKVNKKLSASLDSLLIDFDAALSIQKEADGFKLRPVIKLK